MVYKRLLRKLFREGWVVNSGKEDCPHNFVIYTITPLIWTGFGKQSWRCDYRDCGRRQAALWIGTHERNLITMDVPLNAYIRSTVYTGPGEERVYAFWSGCEGRLDLRQILKNKDQLRHLSVEATKLTISDSAEIVPRVPQRFFVDLQGIVYDAIKEMTHGRRITRKDGTASIWWVMNSRR